MIDTSTSETQISPEYVRISMAAAIELGLAPGRISRCGCGCINLLQSYPAGCYANCTYCGLARERPGAAEDNSFIRVSWPLYPTALVVEKIAEKERISTVGRVCVAQVQDKRSYPDLITMTEMVRAGAKDVPISALVSATSLNDERLERIQEAGADIIGVGLDAASEKVFYETRGRGARGPHDWNQHWDIVRKARGIFGPWKVNCHLVVGLGETDRDLVELFFQLRDEQIAAYLFSFNPEPGTAMQDVPRTPLHRHRRIQLVKQLIEKGTIEKGEFTFDEQGFLSGLGGDEERLEEAIASKETFMTDGCPDRQGEMACNRPYGSYRPGEAYRDYPFAPNEQDREVIREQLRLDEVAGCES